MESVAIEVLLSRVVSALESEASLIAGVGDEIRALKNELRWMKAFQEDVRRRHTSLTETQQLWVDEVTDMAYSAETIIDEFAYHRSSQPNGSKLAKLLYGSTIGFPKILLARRRIARELQKMKRKIAGAKENRELYTVGVLEGITSSQEQQRLLLQDYSESALFFKDENLVGTEDGRNKLVGLLTDAEPQRTVISIVGMGGSGKTTLAANVYNHQNVESHFDCRAWITVSQTYNSQDLLQTMIKDFHRSQNQKVAVELSSMTRRELVETLVDYLQHKSYLVVLDDVWDVTFWSQISTSLPDEGHGSRILLTTRNNKIAAAAFRVKSHVHHVRALEKSEAWELFCRNAFSNLPNKTCPPPLQTIAHNLVEKCRGLPLAIVALAGLMSSKNSEYSEWGQVLNGFTWELSNDRNLERVKIVLSLSFQELTYQLKCCFLYCCLFPEDYVIDSERLTRLWMAEGFVGKVNGRRPEDIAESYIVELISRNMLQVARRDHVKGKPTACKMHDILREFALHILKRDKFCAIDESNGARRLSIQSTERALRNWNESMMKLRTLLVFGEAVKQLPHGLKLLRVLDLEDVPIVKLPDEVAHLFNLRHLNLRRTRVKELPQSIGRLRNLQTLDIADTKIRVLPKGITKLHNLRHLIAIESIDELAFPLNIHVEVPGKICKLKELQILEGVEANPELMKQARNMTQLTRLAIYNVRETEQEDLFNSIQGMKLLTRLLVTVSNEEEHLRMGTLSSAPPCLQQLHLAGKLERVPSWFRLLGRLTRLLLCGSRLREDQDPLQHIHVLPNLEVLFLDNAYAGRRLCFSTGFRNLKWLGLRNLAELYEIIIERGVMPDVKVLRLYRCMQLKMLPDGIQFLTNLQSLHLFEVSGELIQGIEREGSLDRQNIQHIPYVGYYGTDYNRREMVRGKIMKTRR